MTSADSDARGRALARATDVVIDIQKNLTRLQVTLVDLSTEEVWDEEMPTRELPTHEMPTQEMPTQERGGLRGGLRVGLRGGLRSEMDLWTLPYRFKPAMTHIRPISDQIMSHWDSSRVAELQKSQAELAALDPLQGTLRLRMLRGVEEVLRTMPGDLILAALAAPSDFGALARALSDSRVSAPSREIDPLAGAVGRSISHRTTLWETAGEMLSSAQVGDLLRIKRQAIDKRRNAHRLLGLRQASDWYYPAFQFKDGAILPGLEDVLQAHAQSNPWTVLDILLAPDDALGGRTVLQAIQEGDERAIARHVAQATGDGFS